MTGQRVLDANDARRNLRDVLDDANKGEATVIARFGKPVAVVIPYETFLAIREAIEDAQDIKEAEEGLEEYERDPKSFTPLSEVLDELRAEGLID